MDRDAALAAYLAEHDEPCPRCGYNLRMLTGTCCPECGSALRLRVGLVEPRVAALICLIAITFLGFGGSLLFSLLALFHAGPTWYFHEGFPSSLFLILLLVSTGLFSPLAILGRRLIMRRGWAVQWAAAAIAFGYVAVMFILIVVTFDN